MITKQQENLSQDEMFQDLIQQSQIIQGYAPFDRASLKSAVRGWRKGLTALPASAWIPAFQRALQEYESGSFNPSYVRQIHAKMLKPTRQPTDAESERLIEGLATYWLNVGPCEARRNILGPIAEWIEKRPGPRRLQGWEELVLRATSQNAVRSARDAPGGDSAA